MNPKTLVQIRLAIYTLVALGIAWQTTMSGVIWDNLNWVDKTCLFAGIVVLWGNTMGAYFDRSFSRYEQDQAQKAALTATTKTT